MVVSPKMSSVVVLELMQNSKGFTLIELLIAISIVSILSIIGIINYQGIQAKARDHSRKQDLNNLATALEIYYQSHNTYVVSEDGTDITSCPTTTDPSTFHNSIANNMNDRVVPIDPVTKIDYCYISISVAGKAGQGFRLFAKMENTNNGNLSSCSSATYNYSIVSDNLTVSCLP